MWMLDHLDDIESDLSVFHRIDDVWSMPAHKFLRYAERLFAYDGVLAARARAEAQPAQPAERPARHAPDVVEVEPTAAAIAASPLGQIVSIAQV